MAGIPCSSRRRRARPAALVAIVWIAALLACGAEEAIGPPNILLISLDTVRADRLGVYGYDRPTSPHLDALAEGALVFENAYSTSSHTLPAHGSLLTGLLPDTHGLIDQESVLSPEVTPLAEELRRMGYQTAAFVNAGWLERKFGLDRGFEHYDFAHDLAVDAANGETAYGRDGAETNRRFFEWLDGTDAARPFFAFVHYFDAHSDWREDPYEAPPEFRDRFEGERPHGFVGGDAAMSASMRMLDMNARGEQYAAEDLQYVESLYDAGIAHTDALVGELLRALAVRDLDSNTVVVVLADHGEEFQEHGRLLHVQVFDELIRVPLLVHIPGREETARRVADVVQITDLMPTLLGVAGFDGSVAVQGRDLGPLVEGATLPPHPAVSRNQSGTQYALRDGPLKLVQHTQPPALYLFDLEADPDESSSVAQARMQDAVRLKRKLETIKQRARAARGDTQSRPLAPEVRESLEALGYAVE